MNNVEINKQAKLSQHFTLGELCKTSVKTADGNIPSHVQIENMKRVCSWLEMLRQGQLLAALCRKARGQQAENKADCLLTKCQDWYKHPDPREEKLSRHRVQRVLAY